MAALLRWVEEAPGPRPPALPANARRWRPPLARAALLCRNTARGAEHPRARKGAAVIHQPPGTCTTRVASNGIGPRACGQGVGVWVLREGAEGGSTSSPCGPGCHANGGQADAVLRLAVQYHRWCNAPPASVCLTTACGKVRYPARARLAPGPRAPCRAMFKSAGGCRHMAVMVAQHQIHATCALRTRQAPVAPQAVRRHACKVAQNTQPLCAGGGEQGIQPRDNRSAVPVAPAGPHGENWRPAKVHIGHRTGCGPRATIGAPWQQPQHRAAGQYVRGTRPLDWRVWAGWAW